MTVFVFFDKQLVAYKRLNLNSEDWVWFMRSLYFFSFSKSPTFSPTIQSNYIYILLESQSKIYAKNNSDLKENLEYSKNKIQQTIWK